eukprot:789296-Pleurochrysis_carterae.AAC.1
MPPLVRASSLPPSLLPSRSICFAFPSTFLLPFSLPSFPLFAEACAFPFLSGAHSSTRLPLSHACLHSLHPSACCLPRAPDPRAATSTAPTRLNKREAPDLAHSRLAIPRVGHRHAVRGFRDRERQRASMRALACARECVRA